MFLTLISAGLADDADHTNHFAAMPPTETEVVSIQFADAVARQDFAKMKATLTNNTTDYLVYKLAETELHFEHGDYNANTGMLKGDLVIEPKKSGSRTVEASGGDQFHVDSFSVDLKGLYRAVNTGDVEAPDFQLPASANEFSAGNFTCSLAGLKQETKETKADFKCTYLGDGLGFITSSRAGVTVEGQTFANDNKRSKDKVLKPGDEAKITLVFHVPAKHADMQFATMQVAWGETFQEASLEAVEVPTATFAVDPGLTAEKN